MPNLDSNLDVNGLAQLLGTSYTKIRHFYYKPNTSGSYSTFEINKKSGGKRKIMAPDGKLKTLQQRLKVLLESVYLPKKQVMAFVSGRSILSNARKHTRKKYVFNIDLEDFFPTITFARVRGMLVAKPYSLQPAVATVIAHLATVNGHLPQGSPCSPILSNMICSSMDRQLLSLAKKFRAEYSRYADDMTFSFYDDLRFISEEIVICIKGDGASNHYHCMVGLGLDSIIKTNGFKVNLAKVRMQSRYERQVVTGLVVNKKANVDRQYIRKTSAMIFSIEKDGLEHARKKFKAAVGNPTAALDAHLQGRLLFIKQIVSLDSQVYKRLAKRFNLLELGYRVPLGKSKSVRGQESRQNNRFYDSRCWVVETERTAATELECAQGSAFTISGSYVVTCAHVVRPNKLLADNIELYHVSDKNKKFTAVVVVCDDHRDIAILKVNELSDQALPFFEFSETISDIGDTVSVLGFPNNKLGTAHVGRQDVFVRNVFPISAVRFMEVDKELYSGNSGGVVLNQDDHVVGVAVVGRDGKDYEGHSRLVCVSELKKILQETFEDLPVDKSVLSV